MSDSIWKKEVSFKRKPKDGAEPTPAVEQVEVDAVAEPELARELQANVTDRRFVAERLQLGDHGAVVTLLEREAHLPFEAEALLKVGL